MWLLITTVCETVITVARDGQTWHVHVHCVVETNTRSNTSIIMYIQVYLNITAKKESLFFFKLLPPQTPN